MIITIFINTTLFRHSSTIKTTIDKRALAILADASSLITQASQNQLPTQFLRDIFAPAETNFLSLIMNTF